MTMAAFYRAVFAASFLNVVIGAWAVLDSAGFAAAMFGADIADPVAWRAWGGMLLAAHWLYLPGLADPLGRPWINWSSICIKLGMSALWGSLGPGLLAFAVWDAAWGIGLGLAYSRLVLRKFNHFRYG